MMTFTYADYNGDIKVEVTIQYDSLTDVLDSFHRFLRVAGFHMDPMCTLIEFDEAKDYIISREELDALREERDELARELDTKTDPTCVSDWIEWKGGECPVPTDTRVDIKLLSGEIRNGYTADEWGWRWNGRGNPTLSDYDIIAYRVVEKEA